MVEVRHEDLLIKRVTVEGAEELVCRGWAEWIGRGSRRYVRMTPAAPLSALHGFRPSVHTKPVVADGSCRDHAAGQVIGHPRTNREFR